MANNENSKPLTKENIESQVLEQKKGVLDCATVYRRVLAMRADLLSGANELIKEFGVGKDITLGELLKIKKKHLLANLTPKELKKFSNKGGKL